MGFTVDIKSTSSSAPSVNGISWTSNGQEGPLYKYIGTSSSDTLINEAFAYQPIVEASFTSTSNITLGIQAFQQCSDLTSVSFPETLTTLPDNIFFGCNNLTTIGNIIGTIDLTNITTFGCAFRFCGKLNNVLLNPNLTSLPEAVFYNCSSLTSINLPSTIESLGNEVFRYCDNLTEIAFSTSDTNKVITIGDGTFNNTTTLTIFTVNNSVISQLTASYNNVKIVDSNVSCFNLDTKILCLNQQLEEEYIPIQHLRKGDIVKTYLHGYRKISRIGKGKMLNNPNVWNECMFKMKATKENGLLEDLIVTGGHGILVDNLSEQEEIEQEKINVDISIDNKKLLLAAFSSEFEKIKTVEPFTYFHLTVENNGNNDERFGIWANGLLTETPSFHQYISHSYEEL
jgi:hypothetical protein